MSASVPASVTPAAPADVIATLVATRRSHVDDGPPPGRAWCEAATDAVDRALRELAAPILAAHPSLAVVAVGGYGRRELCPRSDVDLLLLHDRLEAPALEDAVRRIVYPLWDAGLTVGYAVRDRREAVAAVDDLDTATAVLDLRPVCGDPGGVSALRASALQRLRRRPTRFLQALARADRERRGKAGDAAEVLEPDLKDGAGGLRDVQSLRWAAAALVGTPGIDPLVPAGYVAAPDRRRLVRAYDRLLAARVALHLVILRREEAGKHERLRLDLQDPVAELLGHVDGPPGPDGTASHDLAPHRLLTELYLAARAVDHVHRRAWALIEADAARGKRRLRRPTESLHDGFELVDGVLRVPEDEDLGDAELPVRLFAALTDTGAVLDRRSASRLRSRVDADLASDDVTWGWSDTARGGFCDVLWRGGVSLPALAEIDDVGLLTALLPEWRELRGRPQRNPFHRFALDRHAWHTAAALGDLVRREPWAAAAAARVDDPQGLILGALLHDVGKAHGEPHEVTGVPVARAIAERVGAAPASVDLVGRMVALHLTIPGLARRRDVTDPALAAEIATEVGDARTLAALHLLAVADGTATGPAAWTDWTASLVSTLVAKVAVVFDDPSTAAALDDLPDGEDTFATAVTMAPDLGVDPDEVRRHVAQMPARYVPAVAARALVRHTAMARSRPAATEVRTRVTTGGSPVAPTSAGEDLYAGIDLDELDVVALDHSGWFAKVAGVVALHGGSIVAADAFTRADGVAIDTFRVQPPAGAAGSWWALVEGDLAEAAAGRLAVRARVARKARGEARRVARLPEVVTSVSTQLDPSGTSTIVEVHTLDRLGVLYAIATALAELELDIVVARVQTLGFEVVDAFYVRDAEGQPLDRDHLAELELGVVAALDEHAGG